MIYEYECSEHGRFEVLKWKPEPKPQEPCPGCGVAGKRVYSVPNIRCTGEGGFDDTVGHFHGERDKQEKMRLLGVNQKDSCGSLVKVPPHYSIQDERVSIGIDKEGV